MNYNHTCPVCAHEHTIGVITAKGSIVEVEEIPEECHNCGEPFDFDKIDQDIHDYVSSYSTNPQEKDNRSEDE